MTSIRFSLSAEAAYSFERSVDPEKEVDWGVKRVCWVGEPIFQEDPIAVKMERAPNTC